MSSRLHEYYKKSQYGLIPNHWEVKPLKSACKLEDNRRIPIKSEDRAKRKGSFPYYGASGIIDYVDDFIFDRPRILLGEDGENILSRNLPLAFIAIGKYWVNNHAHVINPLDNNIVYVCSFLESLDYKALSTGSAQPKLNAKTVESINLLLPPIPEQQKIASILSSVDRVIDLTEQEIIKLKDLKKGMMQELLTKGIGHTKFKDSPVGRIPESWEVKKARTLTKLITKGTTPTSLGFAFKEEGINFVKVESVIEDGIIDKNKFSFIDSDCDNSLKRSRLAENDVVITIAGATVGKLALIDSSILPANTNQALGIMRSDPKLIDFSYLYYSLASDRIKGEVDKIKTTGAQPNLSLAQLGDFLITVPKMSEQLEIVKRLSAIDNLTHLKQAKQKRIETIKKGLMQDLLTGKVRVKV